MKKVSRAGLAVPVITALALSACSSGDASSTGGGEAPVDVLASFYPLQYVAEQVGGDLVDVETLTPPGTEPHNLELAPATVAEMESAGMVVYLSGFQPAVDDAVEQTGSDQALDVAEAAGLAPADEHADEAEDEHADEAEGGHAGESVEEHAEHGDVDPHFWLDPEKLAAVGHAVAAELAETDPANADVYEANAEELAKELGALDQEFAEGLATCESRTIVVAHEAYGYLAEKYDLKQAGISGLEPDTQPSPARLAEIGKVVQNEGVTTIFTESLVNPKVAETLAADLGVETAVLDPVAVQADENADYQQVMRDNLAALRDALRCD